VDVADLHDRESVQRVWQIRKRNLNALDAGTATRGCKPTTVVNTVSPTTSTAEAVASICKCSADTGNQAANSTTSRGRVNTSKEDKEARREQCCGADAIRQCNGTIAHPGTHDVDLLFERAATVRDLETVVNAFLSRSYISSAKHSFQLLRVARVRGRDFVFKVDFLHSGSHENALELFVDHLALDDGPLLYRYQSISVPTSTLLFEEDGRVQKISELDSRPFLTVSEVDVVRPASATDQHAQA